MSKKVILVVEDDSSILTGLIDLLEGEGYNVFSARNGNKAIIKNIKQVGIRKKHVTNKKTQNQETRESCKEEEKDEERAHLDSNHCRTDDRFSIWDNVLRIC